ncbi:MAG TPA: alkaline phosphatase D family protein [Pyrinomonadaceae bacterium]|nr:alkaline phosphatase D family protein [Pyrinomonadaceae bacterium]
MGEGGEGGAVNVGRDASESSGGARAAASAATMAAVGAVGPRSARLWLRTDAAGPFRVEISAGAGGPRVAEVADTRAREDDGCMAFTVPDDAPGVGALSPATGHRFRINVSRTGEPVGEGRFETAPPEDSREPFAFAFMSCHQPFRPDGSVHPDSARMLAALEPALEARGVKYLLLIGDQIYADAPRRRRLLRADAERPLTGRPPEEIRALYHARYRLFWSPPEVRRLQSRWPTWCIWDDHEVADDWGARRKHSRPEWRSVFEGARQAFVNYQVSRAGPAGPTPPASFHQSFVWGPSATFVMDLISQRAAFGREGRIYGDEQLDALKEFLRGQRDRPVVFVVLTVPPAYLPDWLVGLGGRLPHFGEVFGTRWNAAPNRHSLDRLFDVLRAHQREAPGRRLVLLSGDVHQGAALSLRWPEGERAYQFVSSPVTNAGRDWKQLLAKRLSFSLRRARHGRGHVEVKLLPGEGPARENPFDGLNVGVVHVERDGAAVRFELITNDASQHGAARTAFDSGRL